MDTHTPGWIALAIAVVTGLVQIITAFVQRPKEKRTAELEAEERHAALVRYVKKEFSAAQQQFTALKQGTELLPAIDVDGIDAQIADVQTRLAVVERELEHERTQREADRAQREIDRQANVAIQLDLREIATTLKFVQSQEKGPRR